MKLIHEMDLSFSLFLLILCCVTADHPRRLYKLSMVASLTDPGKPAVFGLAESPVWDPEREVLYFVDISTQNVHQLEYSTGKIATKHINYGPANLVATIKNSKRLLVGVRTALYLLDFEKAGDDALRLLTSVENTQPDNVINDGKADINGRFFFGTKGPQNGNMVTPERGAVYSVFEDNLEQPRVLIKPVSVSNGIVWSLNDTVFYYIDSPTKQIVAYDYYAPKGEISAKRTILNVMALGYIHSSPEGMTIDTNGNLWVALMNDGAVLHINPDARQLIFSYKLPVTQITSLAWGGPKMDELFVTTSRILSDPESEPLAGAIFTIRDTGFRGIPPNCFKMNNADNY